MARAAARQRVKATPPGQVVIHPVALKYFFEGDLAASLEPVLDDIETRLSWRPRRGLPLEQRIIKVGDALLALKEVEYLCGARTGPVGSCLQTLTDALL